MKKKTCYWWSRNRFSTWDESTNHSSFDRRSRGVSAEKKDKNRRIIHISVFVCLFFHIMMMMITMNGIKLPVSSARTSFNTCKGHSLRLLCVALILCLFNKGVNFWKYNSDGLAIDWGGVFFVFAGFVEFGGLFSFFGLAAWRCCHFLYNANIGVIPSTQLIKPECAPSGVTE